MYLKSLIIVIWLMGIINVNTFTTTSTPSTTTTTTTTTPTTKYTPSLDDFRILVNSAFARCEPSSNYNSYNNMLVFSSNSMTNSSCNDECLLRDSPFSGTMEKFFLFFLI